MSHDGFGELRTSGLLRIAIVGSGPAGFYAAGQLLASVDPVVEVDVFDRLPTPWGLVRFGVAPDHPKIKSVTRVFEKTARLPGFRFHGNVEVGSDVTHEQLAAAYDAVLYAVGTARRSTSSGSTGRTFAGSHAATEFVAWYNGHPDYADLDFDLSARARGRDRQRQRRARCRPDARAVCRTSSPRPTSPTMRSTSLRASSVREIVVLGRRGPAQAAFTNPELRELADLRSPM